MVEELKKLEENTRQAVSRVAAEYKYAVEFKKELEKIIDLLIEYKADLTVKNKLGDTMLFFAVASGIEKYIKQFANFYPYQFPFLVNRLFLLKLEDDVESYSILLHFQKKDLILS